MEMSSIVPDHENLDKITYIYNPSGDLTVSSFITPAYCTFCKSQIDGFFIYNSSSSDEVSTIECNHCGETIYLVDDEQSPVDVYMSSSHQMDGQEMQKNKTFNKVPIIHKDIYFLNEAMLERVQERTNINFFEAQEIELSDLIKKVCEHTNISFDDLSEKDLGLHPLFPNLPPLVNKWLHLLKKIECI